jgi:hypothetical protein
MYFNYKVLNLELLEPRGEVCWLEMGLYDAVGTVTVEFTAVGLAVFDGVGALETGQHSGEEAP